MGIIVVPSNIFTVYHKIPGFSCKKKLLTGLLKRFLALVYCEVQKRESMSDVIQRKCIVGICAMDKKVKSKAMVQVYIVFSFFVVGRLSASSSFECSTDP